jgi:hypothetical protein
MVCLMETLKVVLMEKQMDYTTAEQLVYSMAGQ